MDGIIRSRNHWDNIAVIQCVIQTGVKPLPTISRSEVPSSRVTVRKNRDPASVSSKMTGFDREGIRASQDGPLLFDHDRPHGMKYSNGVVSPPCPDLWG